MRYEVLDLCRYYDIIDTKERIVIATIGRRANAHRICALLNKEEMDAGGESTKTTQKRIDARIQVRRQTPSPFVETTAPDAEGAD